MASKLSIMAGGIRESGSLGVGLVITHEVNDDGVPARWTIIAIQTKWPFFEVVNQNTPGLFSDEDSFR